MTSEHLYRTVRRLILLGLLGQLLFWISIFSMVPDRAPTPSRPLEDERP